MTTPLRIGFSDYRLEIAHASMLLRRIRQRKDSANCDVVACTAMEAESGRKWALEQEVPYLPSVAAMKGAVDAIIIPAASNPEHHLKLFADAAQLGVPVFIDKPLAPDAATGLRIFQLARERQIPVFSSSALRFSSEIAELKQRFPAPDFVQSWGGWSDRFDEFIIHPVEAAMTVLGPDLLAVSRESRRHHHRISLIYPEDRRCDIYFSPAQQPYEITVCGETAWEHRVISAPFFERLLDHALDAFRQKTVAVPAHSTLSVLKAIDACRESTCGQRVAISWNSEEKTFHPSLP